MKRFISKWSSAEAVISTAALPDIIFMLLFFFMVTTVLRKSDENLKYKIPDAEQLREIQSRPLVREISIGIPRDIQKLGAEPKIQAGGQVIELADIVPFVIREKASMPVYSRDQIIILLKVDEEVPMGVVTDVQAELRKANARRIVYAASWKKD